MLTDDSVGSSLADSEGVPGRVCCMGLVTALVSIQHRHKASNRSRIMLRPLVSDRKYLQVTQAIPPRPQMESLYTKAAGRVASERWTHMWLNVQQGRKVKQH